jgi:hypothetical protein
MRIRRWNAVILSIAVEIRLDRIHLTILHALLELPCQVVVVLAGRTLWLQVLSLVVRMMDR